MELFNEQVNPQGFSLQQKEFYEQQQKQITEQYLHQHSISPQSVPNSTEGTTNGNGKRNQVARACANCRKVHTACDNQRPCKRCILYNLECMDAPRKKRNTTQTPKSKTQTNSKSSNQTQIQSQQAQAQQQIMDVSSSSLQPSSLDQNLLDFLADGDLAPYYFQPDQLSLTDPNSSPSSTSSPVIFPPNNAMTNFNPIQPVVAPQPVTSDQLLDPLNRMTEAITLLTQQMIDLKNSNKALETKLSQVTGELDDLKTQKVIMPGLKDEWTSFRNQSELSVSIWTPNGKELVLTECNNHFKQLVGYPEHILMNNFSATTLLNWQMEVCPRFKETIMRSAKTGELTDYHLDNNCKSITEYMNKGLPAPTVSFSTQIKAFSGFKNVAITIHPIRDPSTHSLKYFLMHTLEIHS